MHHEAPESNEIALSANGAPPVSAIARFVGSGFGGFFELALFHPIDTVAKRLMSNKVATFSYSQVVFKEAANAPLLAKWYSLFPGIGFGFVYKILQRMYKFGGQPYMYEYLSTHHSATIPNKSTRQAVAGSILGVGEVVLLPLDILKIKAQTNPKVLAGRSVASLVRTGNHQLSSKGVSTFFSLPYALFGVLQQFRI
jgi:hypothetical protein